MFRAYETNAAITAPVIQLRAGNLQFDLNNSALLYRIGGEVFNFTGSAPVALPDINVAFAATTAYLQGDMIVEAGKVYYAKYDFTSGATFDDKDRYEQKLSTLPTGFMRAYMFYITYNKEAQTHRFGIAQSADYEDTATGAAAANKLVFPFADIEEPAFVLDTRSRLGVVVVRNSTGSDFVPGTTALNTANLFVHYITTFDNFTV